MRICVVGLGYVGQPLAEALSKHFEVKGFDVSAQKIKELKNASFEVSTDPRIIKNADMIIICVPTPIDKHKKPDLSYLKSASKTVGQNMSPRSIVVYESTVYPGVTEDVCVPILEEHSNSKCGTDFKVGYSPERINPGDDEHSIEKVVKIVSGMDSETLDKIDEVYSKITTTHRAPTIKAAEAAKVIENIQRDLNIALMNELAIIFDKMDIDIQSVLNAAGTKWNFHKYRPGLVGGHCIGVDPYYLTYKAEEIGHHPQVILAGRRINDNMHKHYADKIIKMMNRITKKNTTPNVLILGLTFKPNVADYRNSRVKHLIKELQDYNIKVHAYDPFLNKELVETEFGATYAEPNAPNIDLVLVTVEHDQIKEMIKKGLFSESNLVNLNNL